LLDLKIAIAQDRKVTGGLEKLHNEKPHHLYSSPNIIMEEDEMDM
jgi:hypothetical protein